MARKGTRSLVSSRVPLLLRWLPLAKREKEVGGGADGVTTSPFARRETQSRTDTILFHLLPLFNPLPPA